jgi:hypothetical protein
VGNKVAPGNLEITGRCTCGESIAISVIALVIVDVYPVARTPREQMQAAYIDISIGRDGGIASLGCIVKLVRRD